MKKLIAAVIMIATVFYACKGPTGPQGTQGEQGVQGASGTTGYNYVHFYDSTGVLPAPTASTTGGHSFWWFVLPSPIYDDSCVVQVMVLQDTLHCWLAPTWYYATNGSVKIIDNPSDGSTTFTGYRYWIQVVYKN